MLKLPPAVMSINRHNQYEQKPHKYAYNRLLDVSTFTSQQRIFQNRRCLFFCSNFSPFVAKRKGQLPVAATSKSNLLRHKQPTRRKPKVLTRRLLLLSTSLILDLGDLPRPQRKRTRRTTQKHTPNENLRRKIPGRRNDLESNRLCKSSWQHEREADHAQG